LIRAGAFDGVYPAGSAQLTRLIRAGAFDGVYPAGSAQLTRLIRAGAFDGHGLPMKTPGDLFRREHRAFFNERMGRNESGWFLRTL
jgi:hypothetical protein